MAAGSGRSHNPSSLQCFCNHVYLGKGSVRREEKSFKYGYSHPLARWHRRSQPSFDLQFGERRFQIHEGSSLPLDVMLEFNSR